MIRKLLLALAFVGGMNAAWAAPILEENFDDVANLPAAGWLNINASDPDRPAWGQGNAQDEFPAQSPPPDSYAASSFQSGVPGGLLDNYLATPIFSAANGAVASFYLRASFFEGTFDQVQYGFIDGNADPLTAVLTNLVSPVPTGVWTPYELTLQPGAAGSTARLVFRHFGATDVSNYVGLDTLVINTLREPPAGVPEPASLLLVGLGMAGLATARRRR